MHLKAYAIDIHHGKVAAQRYQFSLKAGYHEFCLTAPSPADS